MKGIGGVVSQTPKDFWRSSSLAVIGGGSWGTVLAHLAASQVQEVRLWMRSEELVRKINSTRMNDEYVPGLSLHPRVLATSDLARVFEGGVEGVIWALPSSASRTLARQMAPFFSGREIVIHAAKGIEEGSLKRISEVLVEELPTRRIGVLSGPNLAHEIARGEPAATVMASQYQEVIDAGRILLSQDKMRVYHTSDVVGVEWAGTLKNILAIAAGGVDALGLGWNARAMLVTRGLAEMVRFGCSMGAKESTFLGLAGVGDLLATCSSSLSRNYRVGFRLAKGETLDQILKELGSTAEGVRTTRSVLRYSLENGIDMPITAGVAALLDNKITIQEALHRLMTRPQAADIQNLRK